MIPEKKIQKRYLRIGVIANPKPILKANINPAADLPPFTGPGCTLSMRSEHLAGGEPYGVAIGSHRLAHIPTELC